MKPYTPRGKIVGLIAAVKADPDRIFTVADAVAMMGVKSRCVGGSLTYALRAGEIFRGKVRGQTVYRGKPFAEGVAMNPPAKPLKVARTQPASGWLTPSDDVRIQQVVPGWKPPQMSAPRG